MSANGVNTDILTDLSTHLRKHGNIYIDTNMGMFAV